MSGYLINFSIYTLAMLGVICAALFVFKGVMSGRGFAKKTDFLNIEEVINLSPRKTIYVLKAGEEKFLIAGDTERTSLIAKLNDPQRTKTNKEVRDIELDKLYNNDSVEDFSAFIDLKKKSAATDKKAPMMRELARKLEF